MVGELFSRMKWVQHQPYYSHLVNFKKNHSRVKNTLETELSVRASVSPSVKYNAPALRSHSHSHFLSSHPWKE